MADKTARVLLTAEDRGASAAFAKVGAKGESTATKIGGAFTKLGGQIGGEFGDILDRVGTGLENVGEHGKSLGAKFAVGGAALAGAGALLVGIGDKEKAASQQLDQAINNTGNSAGDFSKQISQTVTHMEKFGDSASTTKNALATLVNETHDPAKALSMMGEAANLAASKHESLTTAADQLARLLGGKGTKILAAYGITVHKNADGTKDYAGANAQLAKIISGQAAAASDTFTGKLKALRTEIEDHIAVFGQKYGPVITGAGTAMMAAGSIAQIFAARQATAAAAATGNAAATTEETAAIAREGASAAATAGELTGLAGARERAAVAGNGGAAASGAGAAEGGAAKGAGILGLGPVASIAAVGLAAAGVGMAIQKLVYGAQNAKFDKFQASMKGATKEAKDFAVAVTQDGNHLGQTSEAMIMAQAQSNGLSDSFGKAGLSLVDVTHAVAGNDQTFQQLVTTWRNSQHPSSDLVSKLYEMRANYMNGTAAAKKATAQQNQLNYALNAMKPPPPLHIKVIDDASKTVGYIRNQLLNLTGTPWSTTVEVNAVGKGASYMTSGGSHGGTTFKLASGGVMPYDGVGLVGEEGPERVVKHGAHVEVIPIGKGSRGGAARGHSVGGDTYNLTFVVQGGMGGTTDPITRQAIIRAVEEHAGAGGKIVIKNAIR